MGTLKVFLMPKFPAEILASNAIEKGRFLVGFNMLQV
jgi:hypothetical protein